MDSPGKFSCSKEDVPSCPVRTMTVIGNGSIPEEVSLASSYVPFQLPDCAKYESKEALQHGTLYPALFLPFKNMYKTTELPNTPLVQLMALDFAMTELNLYLDTHPNDTDAFEMFHDYEKLLAAVKRDYEEKYGPLTANRAAKGTKYTWISDPWPWELQKGE